MTHGGRPLAFLAGTRPIPDMSAIYSSAVAYAAGAMVRASDGSQHLATAPVPRGLLPTGSGDGSYGDRLLLVADVTGYAGYAGTTGGLAGATYVVTNTNDSGVGSLRAGLESPDPLWIIFDKTVFAPGKGATIYVIGNQITPLPNKTLDGRGASVQIVGRDGGCFLIQGIGNPSNASTTFLRFPGGVANMIFSHVEARTEPSTVSAATANRDVFTVAYGFDKLALLHVRTPWATDGVIDVTQPSNGGVNALYGATPPVSRVTIKWLDLGPHPGPRNSALWTPTGGNNEPSNGKSMLLGLAGDPLDGLLLTLERCRFRGNVQRNPEAWYGTNLDMVNCFVDRWGFVPGIVGNAAHQAWYTANGYATPPVATHGSVGTYLLNSAQGYIRNNVYRAYQPDEPHLLDSSWRVHYPEQRAVHLDVTAGAGLGRATRASIAGNYLLNGAYVDAVGNNPAALPALPYTLTPVTADDALIAELEYGAGNYQPWRKIA